MDKETLSNYGWIVICTLVLAVMIALATPFGEYIKAGVESTVNGLYDVNNKALGTVYKEEKPLVPGATFTDGTFLSWEELKEEYGVTDTTIGGKYFECESDLVSVVIPDSLTSIGDGAFMDCTSLTQVIIGNGVTTIKSSAFHGCTSLKNIAFNGTIAQWNAIVITNGWNYNVPATQIVCSDGIVTL